ncbi:MAG: nucleotidyl transferase AbiEii/AbiGii toxin family protein [Pseudorhodoplanes sp.]
MRRRFEPRLDTLPDAQKKLWPQLGPARRLDFVLYGGTAVALHLGHRSSIDFDFFRSQPLAKGDVEQAFAFMHGAETLQESVKTLVVDRANLPWVREEFLFRRHGNRAHQQPAGNPGFGTAGGLA